MNHHDQSLMNGFMHWIVIAAYIVKRETIICFARSYRVNPEANLLKI